MPYSSIWRKKIGLAGQIPNVTLQVAWQTNQLQLRVRSSCADKWYTLTPPPPLFPREKTTHRPFEVLVHFHHHIIDIIVGTFCTFQGKSFYKVYIRGSIMASPTVSTNPFQRSTTRVLLFSRIELFNLQARGCRMHPFGFEDYCFCI